MKSFPRRKATRYKNFDYNLPGYYFITICSHKMNHHFGKVEKGKMILNEAGKIVDKCWKSIPVHFENVELDNYQIMPNHFHGIVIINSMVVEGEKNNRSGMLLSKVIQQFKRQATIEIKVFLKSDVKIWQSSFYDHIIRNEKDLNRIRKYIIDNPVNWQIEHP